MIVVPVSGRGSTAVRDALLSHGWEGDVASLTADGLRVSAFLVRDVPSATLEAMVPLAARLGLKDWQVDRARRDLSGWNEASLGTAIMAAAQADADVKGASRDPVFALERLVTVIATRAPYGA